MKQQKTKPETPQKEGLIYLNPFWPAAGACCLRKPFSLDYQDSMTLLFRAFERTVNLPILHMDDMAVCYKTAFHRLSLFGFNNGGFNISLTRSNNGIDLDASKYSSSTNSYKWPIISPNTIPLNHSTLNTLTKNPLDLLDLATRFYNFLKFQATLHSEIIALIYCIHRVQTCPNTSKTQEFNNSFHEKAREYFRVYLSTALHNINNILEECPLIIDSYLSKMVCISLLRQLMIYDDISVVQNKLTHTDTLKELLGVANSGIEACSVLLVLYDQAEYRYTEINNAYTESHLIYLTNTMKSLVHGLLIGWHTLRAYKINILRQLGRLEEACTEARELIKLTVTSMQGEKHRDVSFCTCVPSIFSPESLDLLQNKAELLDPITIAGQQSNFIPVHSKEHTGFVQFPPPFHSEQDSSMSSFESHTAMPNVSTIKFPSLKDIYTDSSFGNHLLVEPESPAESTTTSITATHRDHLNDQKGNYSREKEQYISNNSRGTNSKGKSVPDTDSIGCPVHSISSKHMDYRLIYLLTILEGGYDDEAFEYLISGAFRSRLFSRLKANLDYGTIYTTPKKSDYVRFETQSSEKHHCCATSISTNLSPVYYRHSSEKVSFCQQIEDISHECIDDYPSNTINNSSKFSQPDPNVLNHTNKHRNNQFFHEMYIRFVIENSYNYNYYTLRNFLTRNNKLLTNILHQRAYKHITHVFTNNNNKHSFLHNKKSLDKFSLGRLKPSANFFNNLRLSFDPKLLMIINCYFSNQIRGPLSRILFYGPYYQFKCTKEKSNIAFNDIESVIDIVSSFNHGYEDLQSQTIWFNYNTESTTMSNTATMLYSIIDSPANVFLYTQESRTSKSLLHTTPLTTVVATYTLLFLILKRRAIWANKLSQSIFSERMLGCDCALSSMLFSNSMNISDLAMAWPKKCLHLKILPSMLFNDLGVRPAIPSTKLLYLAFSSNPYVVEYLLAKATLPSKATLHASTLLFDVSDCGDPDYFLAAQHPEDSLQFVAHRQLLRMWQNNYCKLSEEKQNQSIPEFKGRAQSDKKMCNAGKHAVLHLSERQKALFQLSQDQRRLEAAIYVSEFGGLWGSDDLYLEIHTLAENLALNNGVLAGIPFSFYIRSLRVITLGIFNRCEANILHNEELQLSPRGYLNIAALDFLLQAYVQYLQFETVTSLRNLAVHTSVITKQYTINISDLTDNIDDIDCTDVKRSRTNKNASLQEAFSKRLKIVWRATILQFKGCPLYLCIRSKQAIKELFYHLIFSYRHNSTPDKPSMLNYVNPLLCLLNTNAQFIDTTPLTAITTNDKNDLLLLLHKYISAFMAGNRKELFSVAAVATAATTAAIESQQTNVYFDIAVFAMFFLLTIISILELKSSFSPNNLILELRKLITFSNSIDKTSCATLLLHSTNDLSYFYIQSANKTKKNVSLIILNSITLGMLSKNSDMPCILGTDISSIPEAETFIAHRDAYLALKGSTCDTLNIWLSNKLFSTAKSSSSLMQSGFNAQQHDSRTKRKSVRHTKSSYYQHKRLPQPSMRTLEPPCSQTITDTLLSSFYIDDDDEIYKSLLRNPGLALRLSRLQRTQHFGLATLNNTLNIEDLIERMFVAVNYSISDLILIYLINHNFEHTNEEFNMSYIYDSSASREYQYLHSFFMPSNVPPLYYIIETGQDEIFMLLMERIVSSIAYRNQISGLKGDSNSGDCYISPEDFCGHSLSLMDNVLIKLDTEDNDTLSMSDASGSLLMYLAARRKARLGAPTSPDLDAFISPVISPFGGTHRLIIYKIQAEILGINLSKEEIDALYTAKTLSKQEIESCINPLWVNTVGSIKLLRGSVDTLIRCHYKGETLLHAASKRDHLHIIQLILLLFPLECYDLLHSFYAILLNHSSNALRFFIASPLHPSLDIATDTVRDQKSYIPTINVDDLEYKDLLTHSIATAYTFTDISTILSNSFTYEFNPLLKYRSSDTLLSWLNTNEQLIDKLQEFQQLVSTNHCYSFLAWAHLIRTLQPFCSGTTGGVSCLNCYHTKTGTCKKNNLFKYLSFAKTQSTSNEQMEKRHQMSITQKLLSQQCYLSGNSLHGCIGLLLSAKIDVRLCTIQNMSIYNVIKTFSRDFVMCQLPLKTPEHREEISYPDPIVLLKYLPQAYQIVGARMSIDSSGESLNNILFNCFCTPMSTPLIMAAQYGSPVCHILSVIISSVANSAIDDILYTPSTLITYINHRDAYGLTALHHATILFIRALISTIKHTILPIISLGLSFAASVPTLYNPDIAIFDNEFACNILASSRANIKALILAGADPTIPDATGVRCCDRLVAMLLEMKMISFPPGYVVERFHEEQPTDLLMHLILWSEKYHKPSRGNAVLSPDSSLTVRVPILIEAKHASWREEVVKAYFAQLMESGHISKDALTDERAYLRLALGLRVQIIADAHPRISTVSSAMQVIIQSNCTRIVSELSIVFSIFLGLPMYQDRSQVLSNDIASSSPYFISSPAEIIPLPFCNVTINCIQKYLDLWYPSPTSKNQRQHSLPVSIHELLLWSHSLYSIYGLRECKFIDEFNDRWSTLDTVFVPWDTDIYNCDKSVVGDIKPSLDMLPAVEPLPPLLPSLSLESAKARLSLDNGNIMYVQKHNYKHCNHQSKCQQLSFNRFRNHIWRRIAARGLRSSSSINDNNVHTIFIDIDATGSAIIDTITMSMSHTLLQSSMLELPTQQMSSMTICDLIKESLTVCFHEEEISIDAEDTKALSSNVTYKDVLCISGSVDDSVLLDLRLIFRRAKLLSILADSICPRSTLLFCSPDDLCFPSAWVLSQCFTGQKMVFDLSNPVDHIDTSVETIAESYTPILSLLNTLSINVQELDKTHINNLSISSPDNKKVTEDNIKDKRIKLFTPNRLGFAKL